MRPALVKRIEIRLVERRVSGEALGQIRIGDEQFAESDQVGAAFGDRGRRRLGRVAGVGHVGAFIQRPQFLEIERGACRAGHFLTHLRDVQVGQVEVIELLGHIAESGFGIAVAHIVERLQR